MFDTLLKNDEGPWLVTGGAGFIGSNIIETLLAHGQSVRCLDDFSTGYRENLDAVVNKLGLAAEQKLEIIDGDVRDYATCHKVAQGVTHVLHQAGLGSVPRSLKDPIATNSINMTKLESYMIEGSFFATQFYVDVEGHPDDRGLAFALEELAFFSKELKIIGVYPAHPFRETFEDEKKA